MLGTLAVTCVRYLEEAFQSRVALPPVTCTSSPPQIAPPCFLRASFLWVTDTQSSASGQGLCGAVGVAMEAHHREAPI